VSPALVPPRRGVGGGSGSGRRIGNARH